MGPVVLVGGGGGCLFFFLSYSLYSFWPCGAFAWLVCAQANYLASKHQKKKRGEIMWECFWTGTTCKTHKYVHVWLKLITKCSSRLNHFSADVALKMAQGHENRYAWVKLTVMRSLKDLILITSKHTSVFHLLLLVVDQLTSADHYILARISMSVKKCTCLDNGESQLKT